MAFRLVASAVISLLVTLFNLLVAGSALASGRRRFALGPLGIGLVTACGALAVILPDADVELRLLAGLGSVLAVTGFALDVWSELGPGAARTSLTLGAAVLVPILFWPAYLLGKALGIPGLEDERPALLLRAFDGSALAFLFVAHVLLMRRGDARGTYDRRAAATLAGTASVAVVLAFLAWLRTGIVVDPTLVGILVAEAFVLVNVLERRVAVRVLLSRSIAYVALLLIVAVGAAVVAKLLGKPVELRLMAFIAALTLLSALGVLTFGELLARGVAAWLFPGQAHLARQLAAAHAEVAAMRARLERTERLAIAGELAAAVAHEIKNPLAAVRGYAELLGGISGAVDDGKRAQLEKAVRIIREESDRIDERVAALLRVGKPATPPASGATVELERTVLEAIAVVEGEPGAPELRPEIAPRLPRVRGEPDAIRGALVNLLRNAVEAGSREAIVIAAYSKGERGVVEIRDRGVGISAEVAGRLFEPFRTTKPTGTGLGLCIARAAAEACGGSVKLESRTDGVGAVARLELPSAEERA